MKRSIFVPLFVAALAGTAQATTFVASDAFGRAAQVDFQVSGSQLVVTLTNISNSDVLVPIDVLTGVYWSMSGSGTLSRDSALLAPGSTVIYNSQPAGGVVGGEWAYNQGLSFHGATFGISSSGLGMFGPGDRFPGPDLQPPTSPNGLEYGIVSAGDNSATGNGGVTGSGGLIKNSVIFTLGGFTNYSINSIANVGFQYGTNVSEPYIETPAPGSLAALGLLGVASLRRRR